MKTIYLNQPYDLRLVDTPHPGQPASPNDAIVRIHAVGICGTDLHAYKGEQSFMSYPRILGHELGVEVIAAGANAANFGISEGDRCAVMPYLSCGSCIACRRGKTNCCTQMQVLGVHVDGGMREYISVPMNLLRKSNAMPYDYLAQVEMLAIGAHAVQRANLERSENVLVIGAGPIGLGVAAFAKHAGARVMMLEINENRIDFCQRWQMADIIDGNTDVAAQLRDLLNGDMPTAVFDATGNGTSMMNAISYVAHGGRLIFVGHIKGELTFSNPEIHKREITIYCSRNATPNDFTQVINAVESKMIVPDSWITHRASFDSLVTDFAGWLAPDSKLIKAILRASPEDLKV